MRRSSSRGRSRWAAAPAGPRAAPRARTGRSSAPTRAAAADRRQAARSARRWPRSAAGRAAWSGSAPPNRAGRRPIARRAGWRTRRSEGRARIFFYSESVLFTTVSGGQRAQEVLDLEGRERLDARRAAGAERDRDSRDRLHVRRLDDVDEVEGAECRPLVHHPGAELRHVLVHLAQALRVRLERLHALLAQRREEDEHGHSWSLRHR